MERRPTVNINDLPPELLAALERLALEQDRTVQELVSNAIDQYVLRENGQLN
jgi:predicted transcriptional regulator